VFTEQTLRKGLKTRLFGNKIYTFENIDSTNNCAKAVAGCGAQEGTTVIAEQQTDGRGRLGRMWQANPNENLMFSIVLRPKVPPEELNLLPLYVAVGVAEAIEQTTKLKVECKWPNDLMLNKKKFAGILIEGSIKKNVVEHVIIGVGINVNQQTFRGELEQKATSIKLETGWEMDRAMLFRETLISLEKNYNLVSSKKGLQLIVPRWVSRSTMINRPISVSQHGNLISGVVKGLSTDGGLILQANGTEKVLSASDVTIVGM
jgi:BirA family biotin operon repressor/biotin-[acetyl-CoA-carboxylase] ligase